MTTLNAVIGLGAGIGLGAVITDGAGVGMGAVTGVAR
ncbi:carbonic anhydrase/acetyltransferase-like protein (isoleucine patch superfamily) [Nonomuraea dietziae]|uniref:Carbonic anhydrase/acetyltransferase-like protein (Isoleucine patch superfamily) n=1 Tax=Nonomuraea dietziae TaxID=65515 RepID=A0A7W5Y976_9ACTN|nr:carbonic anhydrase/acetyltransferase-like protein (isoleucine patch superfamily) [Nonomuraea dietziae]